MFSQYKTYNSAKIKIKLNSILYFQYTMTQKTYFVSAFRYLIKAAFSLKVNARFYFFINYFYQVRDKVGDGIEISHVFADYILFKQKICFSFLPTGRQSQKIDLFLNMS